MMKNSCLVLTLFLLSGQLSNLHAQTGRGSTERVWKDISRLPATLRDDLKKSPWWHSTPLGMAAPERLDSFIVFTHFSKDELYPLNKTTFNYLAAGKTVQSDYVNYGQWVLTRRTSIARDAQHRIVEVFEEEPDPAIGALQPAAKLNFYWHGESDSHCDSILSSQWDDQWQQWVPASRLLSVFNAKDREIATETYRFNEGFQSLGIREEYQYDPAGDITLTRQFLLKNGVWTLLGKVESKFDAQHHEIARQEDIAQGAKRYASVRKLNRNFDDNGNLALEERFKWNEAIKGWAPLKTITKGSDAVTHADWSVIESFKPNAHFKSKQELYKRPDGRTAEREVQSALTDESKTWQMLSETRYFYSGK